MTTTLNPSDKSSRITLSNGNLTATGSGASFANANVRTVNSIASGQKCYFETTWLTRGSDTDGFMVGLSTSSFSTSGFLGSTTTSTCYDPDDSTGIVVYNGAAVGHIEVGALLDTQCCAVDLVNNNWWIAVARGGTRGSWNNSGTADPATNVGGIPVSVAGRPLFPTLFLALAGWSASAAFATADWQYAAPSGFTEVNPTVVIGTSFYATIIG